MTRQEKQERNERIVELRKENKSIAELSELFGLTESAISVICNRYNLGGKRSQKRGAPPKKWTAKEYDRDEPRRIKLVEEKLPGFEYVGNYTGTDGMADIRCKTCGTILTRSWVTIRHSSVSCDVCRRMEAEIQRTVEKEAKAKAEQARIAEKRLRVFTAKQWQPELRCCAKCGAWFIPKRQYQQCCSTVCAERINNARKKDKRLRKLGTYNESITLPRLYERDGGVCHICGEPCDWQDFEIREDGTFIAGNSYPSIDHVVALHDGGAHEWANVKLAHRLCNSKKH